MGPGEGHAVVEAPDHAMSAATASPEVVVGSVVLAIAFAGLVGVAYRWTGPPVVRVPPQRRLDDASLTTEEIERVPDLPTEIHERPTPEPRVSLFQQALGRSRDLLRGGIDRIFGRPIDASALEALEEVLIRADVGIPTTDRLITRVREAASDGTNDAAAMRGVLKDEMRAILGKVHQPFRAEAGQPWVVLVVGVNGSGKTTTIGKLAARLRGEGHRVLLAAGDTYRAAAEQQLNVWAERANVDITALDEGADPGAVAYKAVERAQREGHDVVIVDTAGRLQTRKPLMEQLSKVRRVLDKASPGAPQETLLVLDGTMGQNAMSQARLFHEATPLTGVVVTKLDGTAKGGMILAIATELGLPVKLVGLGEQVGDLRDFEPEVFVDALV
ncbi:MAG: signal recognition particle-docking protein FtsY [Myxococcota bacterium]